MKKNTIWNTEKNWPLHCTSPQSVIIEKTDLSLHTQVYEITSWFAVHTWWIMYFTSMIFVCNLWLKIPQNDVNLLDSIEFDLTSHNPIIFKNVIFSINLKCFLHCIAYFLWTSLLVYIVCTCLWIM